MRPTTSLQQKLKEGSSEYWAIFVLISKVDECVVKLEKAYFNSMAGAAVLGKAVSIKAEPGFKLDTWIDDVQLLADTGLLSCFTLPEVTSPPTFALSMLGLPALHNVTMLRRAWK
jgi:hypothetical protein